MDFPASATEPSLDDWLSLRALVRNAKRQAVVMPSANAVQRKLSRGLEFGGLRQYLPGDEVRHIDWRVYARSGEVFTREFYPETSHLVSISVDVAASMQFGSVKQTKQVMAYRLMAALGWHFSESGGQMLLSELPSRNFAAQLNQRFERRADDWLSAPSAGTHVVISDFNQTTLDQVRHQRQIHVNAHWIWVVDPMEKALPANAMPFRMNADAPAKGATAWLAKQTVDTSFSERDARIKRSAEQLGAQLSVVHTDSSLRDALRQILGGRLG